MKKNKEIGSLIISSQNGTNTKKNIKKVSHYINKGNIKNEIQTNQRTDDKEKLINIEKQQTQKEKELIINNNNLNIKLKYLEQELRI